MYNETGGDAGKYADQSENKACKQAKQNFSMQWKSDTFHKCASESMRL